MIISSKCMFFDFEHLNNHSHQTHRPFFFDFPTILKVIPLFYFLKYCKVKRSMLCLPQILATLLILLLGWHAETDMHQGGARCSNWQRKRTRKSVGGGGGGGGGRGGGGRFGGDTTSRLLLKERESQQKSLLFQIISLFEINLPH